MRRRHVLGAIAAAPLAAVAARMVATGKASAPFLRPPRDGSSSGRCGQCGSPDHTMLDAACPAAPEVM